MTWNRPPIQGVTDEVGGGPGSDTTAWHRGGDSIGSVQKLGSLDGFDVQLVRGDAEVARLKAGQFSVTSLGSLGAPGFTFGAFGFYPLSSYLGVARSGSHIFGISKAGGLGLIEPNGLPLKIVALTGAGATIETSEAVGGFFIHDSTGQNQGALYVDGGNSLGFDVAAGQSNGNLVRVLKFEGNVGSGTVTVNPTIANNVDLVVLAVDGAELVRYNVDSGLSNRGQVLFRNHGGSPAWPSVAVGSSGYGMWQDGVSLQFSAGGQHYLSLDSGSSLVKTLTNIKLMTGADGSAGAPGLAFAAHADAGLFYEAGLAASSGGVEFVHSDTVATTFNRGGVDLDFRVNGDTVNNLIHTDAAIDGLGFHGATAVAQPAAITKPSGGATVDAEARAAIDTLIDLLSAAAGGNGLTA